MTPLRQAMIDECRLRGLAKRTEETYLYAVEQLSRHYHQRPDTITEAQLEQYFRYLTLEKQLARSTIHLRLNGICFFFKAVLHKEVAITKPLSRRPVKAPVMLTPAEVHLVISLCPYKKHRFMLMTYYGTGLRLMELINTKVADIDGQRSTLRVLAGKGNKDRYVILTPAVLNLLREYWQLYRPHDYLFYSGRCPAAVLASHLKTRCALPGYQAGAAFIVCDMLMPRISWWRECRCMNSKTSWAILTLKPLSAICTGCLRWVVVPVIYWRVGLYHESASE